MKAETINLIERPYQEIVDDILTAIVGGIVNEPQIYDDKVDFYPLAQPARDVRTITGFYKADTNGAEQPERYTFQKGIDFVFSGPNNGNGIVWQPKARHPFDETVFYVDYYLPEDKSRSPLSDINVGSVTRTLSEAIGREIATVYQQINQAYLAAFIDTAKGKSLDLVVAILGVCRLTKEYAEGDATFFRKQAIDGNITVPAGAALRTAKGVVFETTQFRTLQRGQVRIDVPIRAAESFKGEAGRVEAGEITTLAQPIAGIDRVSNLEATTLGANDESDDDLRNRARAALRGLGKGTPLALERAVIEARANLGEIWEPNSPPANQTPPGAIKLIVESEPERFTSVQTVIAETRAAGVQTTLLARYIYFEPKIDVQITPGLPAAGQRKIQDAIIAALQAYVDGLSSGEPAEGQQLLKAIHDVDDVIKKGTKIVNVMAWKTDLGKTGNEVLIEAIVTAVQSAIADDAEALTTAIDTTLSKQHVDLADRLVNAVASATEAQARRNAIIAALNSATPGLVQTLQAKVLEMVTGDAQVLRQALAVALQRALQIRESGGGRKADRSLVQSLAEKEKPATADEIAAGDFKVVAEGGDNEKWWAVLDIEPADIVLKEA